MAAPKTFYSITIVGTLDASWEQWFEGMTIAPNPGAENETRLCGYLTDQAALHGLLIKIRDLNLALVGVQRTTENDFSGEPI